VYINNSDVDRVMFASFLKIIFAGTPTAILPCGTSLVDIKQSHDPPFNSTIHFNLS